MGYMETHPGEEKYKENRAGEKGVDPIMMTSIWKPWKSKEGTRELIIELYPQWWKRKNGGKYYTREDFVVYQVDDPNETLKQNRPPQGATIQYIFFIYCPFNGTQEKTNEILLHTKSYATPETECFATYSETNFLKLSEHTANLEVKQVELDGDKSTFVKFNLVWP